MRIPTLFSYAAGVAVALAGCSAGSSSGVPSGLTPDPLNPALATGPRTPFRFHPHRLWISPDAGKAAPRLLFVTDLGPGTVNVYSMPGMVVRGQIGGFTHPSGECADTNGQIWVVDPSAKRITRWSRNLDMTRELRDHDGQPSSCAVDPTTGNLAVSNYFGSTRGAGNVVIYDHATGHGTLISNPDQYYYTWLGYDTKGNLWVDGATSAGDPILSGCGASSCRTIHITGGKIYQPGFVQWAVGQRSWYIADNYCGNADALCIYPVSASGALGKPTMLDDPSGHALCGFATLYQGVITDARSRVLAAGFNNERCGGVIGVARWNFPSGGTPTHDNDGGVEFPYGAAISIKK